MESNTTRKIIRNILYSVYGKNIIKENNQSQLGQLTSILNSLEFKNDILQAGGEIYAVGGIVRDAILNKPSDDLDIVVRGIPYDKLFAILSKYGTPTDTSAVDENGKKDFGSTKFVSSNEQFNQMLASNGVTNTIDIMLPRKDSKELGVKGHKSIKSDVNPMYTIWDDLKRRDITINAVAVDLKGKLYDSGTGIEDLKKGIIRAVSEEAFIEDPLRMIRAIRFAAKFNYQWDAPTLELIKKNAYLLGDKHELPRERFLREFQKMIGKADLGRAVKLLVELDVYKYMFGIESKIKDYSKFDKAKNIPEFSYMLFEFEPATSILSLATQNITNGNYDIEYIQALIKYNGQVKGKNLDFIKEINELANIYNTSPDMLLSSSYVEPAHREIAFKFKNGQLPKGEHDIVFKGDEFKQFIINTIKSTGAEFDDKKDGAKLGKAKKLAVQGIYSNTIPNDKEAIKKHLLNNNKAWML